MMPSPNQLRDLGYTEEEIEELMSDEADNARRTREEAEHENGEVK